MNPNTQQYPENLGPQENIGALTKTLRRFNSITRILPASSGGRKTLNVMLLAVVLPMLLLGLALVNALTEGPSVPDSTSAFNTREVDLALEHTLESQAEALARIAAVPALAVNDNLGVSIGRRLEQFLAIYPAFESLALVNTDGQVTATAGILHQDFYLWQSTPAFRDSLNTRSGSSISPLKFGVLSLDEAGGVDLAHSRIERLVFTAAVSGETSQNANGGLVVGIMKSDALLNAVHRILQQNPAGIDTAESLAAARNETSNLAESSPEIQLLSLTPSELYEVAPGLTTPDSIAIEPLAADPGYTGISPFEESGTSWYSILRSLSAPQSGQFMGGQLSLLLAAVSILLALAAVWFMWRSFRQPSLETVPAGGTPTDSETVPAFGADEAKEVSRRLVVMQESVRREMADYLHGHVQSKLLALSMSLETCQGLLEHEPDRALQMLEQVQEELKKVQDEDLRQVSHELYPAIIKMGLIPAMRSLVSRFDDVLDIDLIIDADVFALDAAGEAVLPEKRRLGVYRIAEEALNNTLKHAQAKHVEVTLICNGTSELVMSVGDDGVGFDPYDPDNAQGLTMMTDYAEAIGGETLISSRSNTGTTVKLMLSLESAEPVLA